MNNSHKTNLFSLAIRLIFSACCCFFWKIKSFALKLLVWLEAARLELMSRSNTPLCKESNLPKNLNEVFCLAQRLSTLRSKDIEQIRAFLESQTGIGYVVKRINMNRKIYAALKPSKEENIERIIATLLLSGQEIVEAVNKQIEKYVFFRDTDKWKLPNSVI